MAEMPFAEYNNMVKTIPRAANPRISSPTHEFINKWWDLALAGNASDLRDDRFARSLIRDRERRLKKNRARIDTPMAAMFRHSFRDAGYVEDQ